MKLSLLDAMACTKVTSETISNCFSHTGFKLPGEVGDAETTVKGEEEDAQQLMADLNVGDISFSDFANIDDNVVTSRGLSDQQIVKGHSRQS